jgi:hypothetical protein
VRAQTAPVSGVEPAASASGQRAKPVIFHTDRLFIDVLAQPQAGLTRLSINMLFA